MWTPGKKDIILTHEQEEFLEPILKWAHKNRADYYSHAKPFLLTLIGLIAISVLIGYKSDPGIGIGIGVAAFIPWRIALGKAARKSRLRFAESLTLPHPIGADKVAGLLDLSCSAETALLSFVNTCARSLMAQGKNPFEFGIMPNSVPPPDGVQCLFSRRDYISNFDVSGSFRDKQKNVLNAFNAVARHLQSLWPEIEATKQGQKGNPT